MLFCQAHVVRHYLRSLDRVQTMLVLNWPMKKKRSITLAICVVLLVYLSSKSVREFLDVPTATADSYVKSYATSFPVLTVCPAKGYKRDILKANGMPHTGKYIKEFQWSGPADDISPSELFDSVTYELDEVIKLVHTNFEGYFNGKHGYDFHPGNTTCGQEVFSTAPYYFFGNCHTVELPKCITDLGIDDIAVRAKVDVDIFVHHKHMFLSPDSQSRISVSVGSFARTEVIHDVVELLGTDGSCLAGINYDECMYQALYDKSVADVGCTVPWLRNRTNICQNQTQSAMANNVYQENRRNQAKICPRSCEFTNVVLMSKKAAPTGRAQVIPGIAHAPFFFRLDVKKTKEYLLFTDAKLLGDVVNYVGLIIGICLFNLVDVFGSILDKYMS